MVRSGLILMIGIVIGAGLLALISNQSGQNTSEPTNQPARTGQPIVATFQLTDDESASPASSDKPTATASSTASTPSANPETPSIPPTTNPSQTVALQTQSPSPSPSPSLSPVATATQEPTSQPPPTPEEKTFTIEADDFGATPAQINVTVGDQVTIAFKVRPDRVYYGGLNFRSPVVESGAIPPGGTKTVTFVAAESFEFVPTWPASQTEKPYRVKVVVSQ